MKIHLGLGSNLGDRKANIERAIGLILSRARVSNYRISPIYENPALLEANSPAAWNLPFLNLVLEIESEVQPLELLLLTQKIESELGRVKSKKWQPRPIDIDLLLLEQERIELETLQVPHPEILNRSFVLDPLKDLISELEVPTSTKNILQLARKCKNRTPLWMGILNITSDSFSDGGINLHSNNYIETLNEMLQENINIIDIGAESTRPGANTISADEEWSRLKPVFLHLKEKLNGKFLKPLLSVDTKNYTTAVNAIELGADIINDVSGLADDRFIDLLCSCNAQYILTHSLTVPADPNVTLSNAREVNEQILEWFDKKINMMLSRGVKSEQITIDPGIGFGKTALQSQQILQNIEQYFQLNHKILVGHSRKSFMKNYSSSVASERDLESVGVTLALAQKGVDIIRVHRPELHQRAFRGFSHCR